MQGWGIALLVILPIITAIIGGIIAVYITQKIQEAIKRKSTSYWKMIRVMFQQMGRKASEAQIRQVMRSMKNAQ